jgi:hypothetical protein
MARLVQRSGFYIQGGFNDGFEDKSAPMKVNQLVK